MRRRPSTSHVSPFVAKVSGSVRDTYRLELITPMLGGGVRSWFADRERPVRLASIKSQLRFWWRTTQTVGTQAELLDHEHRLWGGADATGTKRRASAVSLDIATLPIVTDAFESVSGREVPKPKYVFFPLEKPKNMAEGQIRGIVLYKASFDLIVTLKSENTSADWPQVLNSLRLWALFGGLGARTRRGCGSVFSPTLLHGLEGPSDVAEYICGLSSSAGSPTPYPSLHSARFAASGPSKLDPLAEWNTLVEAYGAFRQGPGVGRGRGFGRSYWPEADSIREEIASPGPHVGRHLPSHPSRPWYPRAAYGLPIQFKFGSPGKAAADGDPPGDNILYPEGASERWPSPVILKVIKFPNGTVSKICLVLNHAEPSGLRLNSVPLPPSGLPSNFASKLIRTSGLHGSPPGTEPIEALLHYLQAAQRLTRLVP